MSGDGIVTVEADVVERHASTHVGRVDLCNQVVRPRLVAHHGCSRSCRYSASWRAALPRQLNGSIAAGSGRSSAWRRSASFDEGDDRIGHLGNSVRREPIPPNPLLVKPRAPSIVETQQRPQSNDSATLSAEPRIATCGFSVSVDAARYGDGSTNFEISLTPGSARRTSRAFGTGRFDAAQYRQRRVGAGGANARKDRANEREDPLAIRLVAKRPHEQQVRTVGRWRVSIEPVDAAVRYEQYPWVIEQRSVLFTASDQRVEAREQLLLPRVRSRRHRDKRHAA